MTAGSDDHVILGLGSNLGDRLQNLASALELLTGKFRLDQQSDIYETEPWGYLDQPAFLNQVVIGSTALNPLELLAFIKSIEADMGRTTSVRFGPRIIDIDILTYGMKRITIPELTIPHPRMLERAFVLFPLNELLPDMVIPGSDSPLRDLMKTIDVSGVRKFHPSDLAGRMEK